MLAVSSKEDDELRKSGSGRVCIEVSDGGHALLRANIADRNPANQVHPNYAGDDDEDGEMEDFEDENLGDAYSDNEDILYKIRRSAAKLLSALIETRPEFLRKSHRCLSSVSEIVSRRKRISSNTSTFEVMEVEGAPESPITLAHAQAPSLAKARLAQLRSPFSKQVLLCFLAD